MNLQLLQVSSVILSLESIIELFLSFNIIFAIVKWQDKSLTLKEMRWHYLKQENGSNEKPINTC